MRSVDATPAKIDRARYDPTATTRLIAFYDTRTKRDPRSFLDFDGLAGAYLQRFRESFDIADAVRAESIARKALDVAHGRHRSGYVTLIHSLLAQHRFQEALRASAEAVKAYPSDPAVTRIRAECLFEVGEYEAAEKTFKERRTSEDNPADLALQARFLQLKGQPEQALAALRRAVAIVDRNIDISNEHVAWFHERVGEQLALMGRPHEAEAEFKSALDVFPRSYKSLAALSRIAAARDDWRSAIKWGEKAVAIVPGPDALAVLVDSFKAVGDDAQASRCAKMIDASAALSRASAVVYDRQRALYLCDHGMNLNEALTLARAELKQRHDIYSYDALAWAALKNRRFAEADSAIRQAMRYGTKDPQIWSHAAEIYAASGKGELAREFDRRAAALNPAFRPGIKRLKSTAVNPLINS